MVLTTPILKSARDLTPISRQIFLSLLRSRDKI